MTSKNKNRNSRPQDSQASVRANRRRRDIEAERIANNSPVDPMAATVMDDFHGTDLINGVGHHPEEEDRDEENGFV